MRFKKIGAALLALLIVSGLAVRLSAQGDNNGNPTILAAVQHIQGTLDDLITALNAFVASSAPGNVAITPSIAVFPPDSFSCTATNVSDNSRNIRVQLLNGITGASIADTGAIAVNANSSVSASLGVGTGTRAFCKITVVNGVKTDMRGVLALFAATTASDKLLIAAE